MGLLASDIPDGDHDVIESDEAAAVSPRLCVSGKECKIAETVLGFRPTSGSADAACFKGFLDCIQAEALAP